MRMADGPQLLKWRIILTCLVAAVLLVRGTLVTPFDGLPLSPTEVVVVLVGLVIIWTHTFWFRVHTRRWLLAALVALLGLNLIGQAILPRGWSICLRRSQAVETLQTPCEPSIAYRSGIRSFVVPTISFHEKQFPLYFMNDKKAFNFHKENEPDRETLSYSMEGEAFFARSKHDLSIDTNLPETTVRFNEVQYSIGPDDTLQLSLASSAINHVSFAYEKGRSDADAITITTSAKPYYRLVGGALPSEILAGAYGALYWAVLVYIAIALGSGFFRWFATISRQDKQIFVYAALVALLYWLSQSNQPLILIVAISALMLLLVRVSVVVWKKALVVPLLMIACLSAIFVQHVQPYGQVDILNGGDDPLTYEGYARIVVLAAHVSEALKGGTTGVFYYQPLYRYELAILHLVTGESLWGPYVVQLSLFILALLLIGRWLYRQSGSVGVIAVCILLVYAVAHIEVSFITLALTPYQEALAIPVFLLCVLWLLALWQKQQTSWRVHMGLGCLWGLALFTRTDLLPALSGIVLYFFAWRRITHIHHKTVTKMFAGFVGGFVIAPLALLLRNLLVAHIPAILPTSGYVNLLIPFKDAVPSVTRATFGIRTLLFEIPKAYTGKWSELASILGSQAMQHFVGQDEARQIIWLIAVVTTVLAIWKPARIGRIPIIVAWIIVLSLMFTNAYFLQDNSLAVVAQYTLLSIFLGGLATMSYRWSSGFAVPKRILRQFVSK